MAYWLVKSEPSTYSLADLKRDKKTVWDGVRNYAARNNLRSMKKGDEVFFYHSNEGKEIVGIAKVVKEAYPDPTAKPAERETWSVVELGYVSSLKKPVTLQEVKVHPHLNRMQLVTRSRLSVQGVSPKEFKTVLSLAK